MLNTCIAEVYVGGAPGHVGKLGAQCSLVGVTCGGGIIQYTEYYKEAVRHHILHASVERALHRSCYPHIVSNPTHHSENSPNQQKRCANTYDQIANMGRQLLPIYGQDTYHQSTPHKFNQGDRS